MAVRTALALAGVLAAVGAGSSAPAAGRPGPDLVVRSLSHAALPGAGGTLRVRHAIGNAGSRRARGSVVGYYLSADRRLSRTDVRLRARIRVRAVKPGGVVRGRATLVLPGLRPGGYWLFVCADDRKRLRERRESNNCRRGRRQVTIAAPAAALPRPVPAPVAAPTPAADPSPAPAPPAPVASETVGPAGGRVVTPDGRLTLDFPSGAVADPIEVTVTPVSAPPGLELVPGTTYELGPDGTDFLAPVTVTLAYDPSTVAGPEADLSLVELVGDDFEHRPGAPVDEARDRVAGQLRGFSTIGVRQGVPWPGPEITATWNADRSITVDWSAVAEPAGPPGTVVELHRALVTGTLREPLESEWFVLAHQPPKPFVDRSIGGAALYWFRARWAVGRARSLWSRPVRVAVFGASAVPAAPADVTAQPLECGGVRLTWSPVSDAGGYTIRRSEGGGSFTTIASVGGIERSYVDDDVNAGQTYGYQVLAESSSGQSQGSAVASATSSSSRLSVALSSYEVAIPPGGSAGIVVGIDRHGGDYPVELSFEPRTDLAGAVMADFDPPIAFGDSAATISVDARAGTGLVVTGVLRATARAPGSGSCAAPLVVYVGRARCEIWMPDVTLPSTTGTRSVDLFVDRIGFADRVTLEIDVDDTRFADFASVSFVPNPARSRSSAVFDLHDRPPGQGFETTALVRGIPPPSAAPECARQIRLRTPAH